MPSANHDQTASTAVAAVPRLPARRRRQHGLTLIELIIVVALGALLASIAVPAYSDYAARARIAKAIADIRGLDVMVQRFELNNQGRLPDALGELNADVPLDPWGQAYSYFNIRTAVGKGNLRKDGKLNPINSDFDLYSIGPDGESRKPLKNPKSHDDIIRANNGSYVGLGSDY